MHKRRIGIVPDSNLVIGPAQIVPQDAVMDALDAEIAGAPAYVIAAGDASHALVAIS
jgi:hypothetical protein